MTGQICTNHYTDSHLPHQQIEAKASKHTIFKSKEASVIRLCNNRSIRKWIHSTAGTCQANTYFSHTSVEENGHPLSRLSWFKMYKVHAHQCIPQVLISHTCRQALLPGCGFWTADWPVLVPGGQSSQPKMIRSEEADLPCKWVTTGVTAFSTDWVMLKKSSQHSPDLFKTDIWSHTAHRVIYHFFTRCTSLKTMTGWHSKQTKCHSMYRTRK